MHGLLGRRSLQPDEALLLERTRSVHTFGMRFPILVALLDRDGVIRTIVSMVPRRVLLPRPGVRYVLEANPGADLRSRDRLVACQAKV